MILRLPSDRLRFIMGIFCLWNHTMYHRCFDLTCELKWDFDYNSSFLQHIPSGNRSCCSQNLAIRDIFYRGPTLKSKWPIRPKSQSTKSTLIKSSSDLHAHLLSDSSNWWHPWFEDYAISGVITDNSKQYHRFSKGVFWLYECICSIWIKMTICA